MTKDNYIQLKKTLLLLICSFSFSAVALDYTTISDGNWNDPTIWSTDGGSTPCGCTPSNNTNGDNITIDHTVNMTNHLSVSGGSVLTVSVYGHLWGSTFNLSVTGGSEVHLRGNSTFQKLFNGNNSGNNGGSIIVYNTIVQITGQVRLNAGTFTSQGYVYLPGGNLNVYPNASIIMTSGAKFELFGGNITNEGTIEICSDCCLTTTGNWTNDFTGIISGSGSATTTGGNMTNLGTFSTTATWCSAGFDAGMPSTEDCTTSNTTCGIIVLPVELSVFEGTALRDHNLLSWITASEKDCMEFTVTISSDGNFWTPIGTVACNGTTTSKSYYEFQDFEFEGDLTYYRLEQTDIDGAIHYSSPISITRKEESSIKCYPNPVSVGESVFISGTEGIGSLTVFDPTGKQIYSQQINQPTGGSAIIETGLLKSGVYLVQYTSTDGVQRTKFAVQ